MPLATPEELAKYPPPPLPGWIRHPEKYGFPDWKGGSLLPAPETQVTFLRPASKSGKPGEAFWHSICGSQSWFLRCPYDEIMIGGERGGAKTAALIAWMAMGDPMLSPDDPAHYSYLLEPSYRGLVLRKEYQSLTEVIDEMKEFYGQLGGVPKDDPVVFTFKSGAKIYTNHLADKNAFEKYRGLGLTRIGIEELTQIEEKRSYQKLLGSLRAKRQIRIHNTAYGRKTFPALRSQIASTANPDGDGKKWVKARFVSVLDSKGNEIKPNTPMRDQITGLTRIFIPMHRKDNPYLRDNKQYEGYLLDQDEATVQAWVYGNWNSDSGTFFKNWRPNGPVTAIEREKYPWARHVTEPITLAPYFHRWGGGDFGFDHPAAFHKFCHNQTDGRIHLYDELMLRGVGSFDMGVKVAKWWLPDMEYLPDKTVTIAFSSDAFSKTDDTRTKAEQIAAGVNSVLGPYGAFLLKYTDEERQAMSKDPTAADRMFQAHRAKADGKFVIILKPASKDTEARWSYMRDLLNFKPTVAETEEQLKERLKQTFARAGADTSSAIYAYEKELSKVKRPVSENLPKLQVWRGKAPEFCRCMEEATKDEDHPLKIKKWNSVDGIGGDDALESCFVAGTMIETEHGRCPIEDVSIGDLVWTREGLRPVVRCGMTSREALVQTLAFSNGSILTGTLDHPVFDIKNGFKRLDTLRYGDIVETWQSAKPSSSTELNSGAIQSLNADTFETISGQGDIIVSAASVRSIRKSGLPRMGRFQMDTTSITRTKIASTTISEISKLSWAYFIIPSIHPRRQDVPDSALFSHSDSKKLLNGIDQKLAENLGEKTPNSLLRFFRWLINHVMSAVVRTRQNGPSTRGFARISVKQSGAVAQEQTILKKHAKNAAQNSPEASSTKLSSAPVSVVRLGSIERSRVFNLSVAGTHEYYANGILVHNCGHGLHHFKALEKEMPKSYYLSEKMETIQKEFEEQIGERLTDPTRLVMVHLRQNQIYDQKHPPNSGSFNLPRASSSRHRIRQPNQHGPF